MQRRSRSWRATGERALARLACSCWGVAAAALPPQTPALERTARAEADAIAAHAEDVRGVDPQLALLLALEAVEHTRRAGIARTPRSEQALRAALHDLPGRLISDSTEPVQVSSDGRWIAQQGGEIRLAALEGELEWRALPGIAGEPTHHWFAPNDRWLVAFTANGLLQRWEVGAALAAPEPFAASDAGWGFSLPSPSGRHVATIEGTRLSVWDVNREDELLAFATDVPDVAGTRVFFDDHDRWAAVVEPGGRLLRWALAGGAATALPEMQLAVAADPQWDVAPGGGWLTYVGEDGATRLLAASGAPEWPEVELVHGADPLTIRAYGGRGRWVAAGHTDGRLYLIDLTAEDALESARRLSESWPLPRDPCHTYAGRCLRRAVGPPERWLRRYAGQLRFSPDGQWLVGCAAEGRARLWSTATGVFTQLARDTGRREGFLAFAPDSRSLVEVDENEGTVDLLILHEGESRPERLRRYRDGPPLHPLAFSPDGRWLMTSGAGGGVRAWCLSRDAVAMSHAEPRHLLGGRDAGRTLRPHAFHRHDVVWLGAHQMVTSSEGVERAELRLWDAAEPRSAGEPLLSTRAEGYGWAPSADGTWTYPISQLERPFFHLDVGRRRLRATVIDAALHEFMANVVGDVLFVGGMLSSLGYCRLGQDGTIANLRLPPAHWGFLVKQSSASGRWSLVQPKGEERLVLWNVAPDDRVVQVELPGLEAGVPLSARYAFDANAERLACALDDGRLFVWSLAHDAPSLSRWGDPTDHTITLTRSAQYLYWLGDHDVLTVVDADGATWLWDLAAARPSGQRMRPDPPDPDTWSVSADGRWLFALDGGTGRVWPLQSTRGATGFTVGSFRPGERSWFQLSGDGAWLLGASDGEWRVTRVDPRRPKATHHRLAPNLEGVGVSPIDPSGRWIVTWGDAEGARLWSLDTERATVVASELFVSSAPRQVVFSEDGRYLVAQVGERACLWDLELDDPSGPPVLLPATDIDRLVHCADGRVATLGGACLRVWSLRLEELVAYAGRRVERELTPSERAAYLPDP